MTDIRELHEGENPSAQNSWILVEEDGPVWVVNSATYADDTVPSDPLGPFHVRTDAVKAASELARSKGIEIVYVRGTA
ncbi:hypothetical protein GCM10007874_01830 [Labrys miyagiensis]|uniref:DUF2188 domain-containing protein n=1 Tax=Labrys miyagiensis TaxID=346912 RepID=A0ABQ6CBX5_9HYPH|nr:hypothetical protein [Labrys miyagiensis]GLS17168.1 hypothetical protein GCM10007874_01830 [Labrys miyagiensis]